MGELSGWSFKPHLPFPHLASVSFVVLIVTYWCTFPAALPQLHCMNDYLYTINCSLTEVPEDASKVYWLHISERDGQWASSSSECIHSRCALVWPLPPHPAERGVEWRRLMELTSAPFTSPAWSLMPMTTWRSSTTCRSLKFRSVTAMIQTPAGYW